MKEKKKKRADAGFTLAETLLAVLILLMVSVIVANGVPVAKNAYERVVIASNAEILLSTTMSTLRNELGLADDVKVKDGVITYYNQTLGVTSKICRNSDLGTEKIINHPDGAIMYQRYAKTDLSYGGGDIVRLVSKEASTHDLYVTYDSVVFNDGIITFKGLTPSRGSVSKYNFSIRVISYEPESSE